MFRDEKARGLLSSCRGERVSLARALSVRARSAGARHLIPDAQGARSQQTVVNSAEQMSADPEEILYDAVHRCEALQMGGGLDL